MQKICFVRTVRMSVRRRERPSVMRSSWEGDEMATKQPQVTEQTRANLTQAFWSLYLEKPIEKITIREITDRAGYNRATFYLYYRDVYDLFDQFEEGVLGKVRTLVNEHLMHDETLNLKQHMGLIVELAQQFDGYLPRLMSGDPSFSERLKAVITPLLDRFILNEAALTEDECRLLREFYASGLLASINAWMTAPDRIPLSAFIDLIVGTVLP